MTVITCNVHKKLLDSIVLDDSPFYKLPIPLDGFHFNTFSVQLDAFKMFYVLLYALDNKISTYSTQCCT